VEGAWQQGGLNHEQVPGIHFPDADAGCGVAGWDARGEVHNLFDGIINELPPKLVLSFPTSSELSATDYGDIESFCRNVFISSSLP
jgi:hypothetical protein